jgi:hypothetical protein
VFITRFPQGMLPGVDRFRAGIRAGSLPWES